MSVSTKVSSNKILKFFLTVKFILYLFLPCSLWAEEPKEFKCPQTDYPLFNHEGPPPSGQVSYDEKLNAAYVACSYAEGQYELYIDWRLNVPEANQNIKCYNDEGNFYNAVKHMEEPFDQRYTYNTVEDFGIDIKEGNGFFWIEYVHKHSPAFNAKLQRDTKIIAINGQTLTGMTLEQVNGVLHKAEKEDKKITITIQGKNDKTTQNVMLPIEPYDSYGVQIRVYNKGRWARADLLLNPNEVITDEMKTYWIGVARKALDGLKEQALACRDS